ncbi:nucleotidyltransferase domain-containing protein [Bacillus sp. ISL-40]|uniref:nucleotidyltransferase domain-containing protein n=1 Tax=unclassified Bacillus (in: firmicutes) TaxID=185979 RepID=UPI001BE6343B|nr:MULTISPECIES: nucleotidyltransferase domain-containing protein [unclassified Bacillus (in: firmicutes)]MBT2696977.1 nucleotidyltransferase domain-containing protein [Bacillus sp. ISL-40]MBT2741471.1 nucleotidyltransferase domain-containing protein [Bacillus sp. ISL-77]
MKEKILTEIKKIEEEYGVRICLAVESGSRAWGFPSKDSDYDVRFIYVHKMDWYLSIDQKRDVIELPINDLLDINGWELRKALQLFRKSNPPLMEWLHSGIVYYQAFSLVDKLKAIQNQVFLPQSALYHYLNMAKGNFRDYLRSDQVKIKKYFYVLRPVLACMWIERYNSVPPIEFQTLVEELLVEGPLKKEILTLLERKISGDELNLEPKITSINDFLEKEINRLEEYTKTLRASKEDMTPILDDLFREVLDEVWA